MLRNARSERGLLDIQHIGCDGNYTSHSTAYNRSTVPNRKSNVKVQFKVKHQINTSNDILPRLTAITSTAFLELM